MTIISNIFPHPDSHYATNGIKLDKFAPLAILAFHLNMTLGEGNVLQAQRKKGYYLFRESAVPFPRPCTQLAWERLCRLGRLNSHSFLVPFLPALRDDDESGAAISEKGTHVSSLSRRSPHHIRESVRLRDGKKFEAIIWGDCYVGSVESHAVHSHTSLMGRLERSNVVESLVLPRRDIEGVTSQESIRDRLEFLAQYGLPATHDWAKKALVPRIHKLLFQFLSQQAASFWADEYVKSYHQIRSDPGIIQADFNDMLEEQRAKRLKQEEKEEESITVAKIEKISTKRGGTVDYSDLSL